MSESLSISRNRLLAGLVVTASLTLGLVLTLYTGGMSGWILLLGLLAVSLFFARPSSLVPVYWGWAAIVSYLRTVVSIPGMSFVDEALVSLMVCLIAGSHVLGRAGDPELHRANRLFAVLLIITGVSAVVNRVPPLPAFHFVTTYFACFAVFYMTIYYPPSVRAVFAAVIVTFIAQLILNFTWYAGVNPLPNFRGGTVDFAIGSFGSCDLVAYFCIFVLFLMRAANRYASSLATRLWAGVLALAGIFQLFITFTVHAYLLFVLGVLVQMAIVYRSMKARVSVAVGMAVVCASFYFFSATDFAGQHGFGRSDLVLTANSLGPRSLAMWSGPKGQVYKAVLFESHEDLPFVPIGGGPGNFASPIASQYERPLAEKYVNVFFSTYSGLVEMYGSSVLQSVLTGFLAIYGDLGFVGMAVFFGLHFYAFGRILSHYQNGRYRSREKRMLAEALLPSMVLFFVLVFITDVFSQHLIQSGIWMCVALLWKADLAPAATPPEPARPTRDPMARFVAPV